MTGTIRIPRRFFDDHDERLADDPTVPLCTILRESPRFVWVTPTDPGLTDLLNDARHYADPDAGIDRPALVAAARRLLKAVA